MIEILASNTDMASELISRTSSTANVQKIVQLSLAPVFLLAAIGAFLNVMNSRLIWLTERLEHLDQFDDSTGFSQTSAELPYLRRRLIYATRAINLSTFAALIICVVVSLMFISAFIRPLLGTLVASTWILAMASVFVALLFFLIETRIASKYARERYKPSRKKQAKTTDLPEI